MINRNTIAQQFIRGVGIEVGAFHNPWPFDPVHSKVRYIDKADPQTVLSRHPDMPGNTRCVVPHSIDDAQTLKTIADDSVDFLIASHVLEHCLSPLTAIENHLRVVKSGGHIAYALPDKRHTFDKDRENSDCTVGDYQQRYSEELEIKHYHNYLFYVDKVFDVDERRRIAKDRISKGMDVHYHAWDSNGIYDLFKLALMYINKRFEVVLFYPSGHEVFIVLRRL